MMTPISVAHQQSTKNMLIIRSPVTCNFTCNHYTGKAAPNTNSNKAQDLKLYSIFDYPLCLVYLSVR